MLQIRADVSSVTIDGRELETSTASVTRYRGDAWDRIASDIVCGVADATAGACIAITAAKHMVSHDDLATADGDEWAAWSSGDEGMSLWRRLDNGWLLLPRSRDGVENVMAWTMPYLDEAVGAVVADSRVFVYDGRLHGLVAIQNALCRPEADVQAIEDVLRGVALFEFTWTFGFWKLLPLKDPLDHLIRLAEPVVSRINATLL